MIKEEFLHYIWKQQLFEKVVNSHTEDAIEILSTGIHNTDSGPDFINARVKINNTLWAGNVEIHTDSVNWERHNHHKDPAYNNVILHVVNNYSRPARRQNGEIVPTVTLKYDLNLLQQYSKILAVEGRIPCKSNVKIVDDFSIKMWLDALSIERLEEKTTYINEILKQTNDNWEDTYYVMVARNFGFKTNSLPFEMLAKSIPLKLLAKYSAQREQLEALLFGQAGFLKKKLDNKYYEMLCKEYQYMCKVHNLRPLEYHLWKFMRLRPSNFPTIRIAQFAGLVFNSKHLFSKTIEARSIEELTQLFQCEVSEFWQNHYTFEKESISRQKPLGNSAVNGLLINTVIPFLFIYGKLRIKPILMERAQCFLSELASEKNSTVKLWDEIGVVAKSAADSQALLQLTNNYCSPRNCLYCQIGNTIIRNKN